MAHETTPSSCPLCGKRTASADPDAFCEACLAAAETAWPQREPSLRQRMRDPEHRAETQAWLNRLFSGEDEGDEAYEDGCACGRGDVIYWNEVDGQIVAFEGADGTEHTIQDDEVRRGSGGGCSGSLRDHEWTDEELGLTGFEEEE